MRGTCASGVGISSSISASLRHTRSPTSAPEGRLSSRLRKSLPGKLAFAGAGNPCQHRHLCAFVDLHRGVESTQCPVGIAHPDIGNVAQALEFLEGGIVPNVHERRFLAAKRTLDKLDDDTFRSVIVAHRDRVLAALGLGGVS